ncbi:oligogalacturonate-specific porin protein KdgM [Enterobacter sp. BIGb0383]|uniref:oligogalacturonate-specific porin KdgM family protein n=1 Tax=unclassified Enterobacter TaxID=2608935 RepID=UPI000FA62D81|nr:MULTISPECIES: oligogalacturonate-specific porin KdgM family protein [unclassified Enterobacter]ROP48998.1 oligogalacturonate-specific porin protein KdgM [Enterobacter sp. BIGb0383]ROS00610.1 oligogalacturonate-specific porin protein KdgM [Enterobacter sp. BIGb0359]
MQPGKITQLLFISGMVLIPPVIAYAEQPHGFVDYRHEYLDKSRTHGDRVEFGTFFSNGIGLLGEIRYNTDEGKKDKFDPSGFANNGHGLSILYRFKPVDEMKLWLEPSFWLDSTSFWTTYEYGLTAGYDFSKEWKVSGRFRYDMDKATAKSLSYGNEDRNNRRYDVWIDYRPDTTNFQYQLNLVYYDNNYKTWNNGNKNYTVSFKTAYKMGSWTPYISVADYKGIDKTSSNRQIRWRLGMTYSF